MRKIFVVITIIGIGFINVAKGQSNSDLDNNSHVDSLSTEPFSQKQFKVSKINYFLNEDWQGGLIQLKDNRRVNGYYLYRYNIYTDQIELKSTLDPSPIDIISIGAQKFIYSDFIENENSNSFGYFELIVNGDCKLLIRRYVQSNGQDYGAAKTLGKSSNTRSSTVIKEYYIKKGTNPAVILDNTKECLLKYLSDKNDFQEYLDKKFILFLNKNKLIELISYYNKI